LLQKPSSSQNPLFVDAMLQHVRVKLNHGDARGTVLTTYYILVILDEPKAIPLKSIQWDAIMPSVASIWEEKDVV
jgi:tetrahydromethanopterin S-methyltransferase subunit E